MSLPRFMLNARALSRQPVVLTGADARHCRSLRLQVDDPILVSDSVGGEFHARIVRFLKHGVEVRVGEASCHTSESSLTITLYQGFAKGSKLEIVLQKTTELGVTRVVPLLTERSQVKPREDRDQRGKRWQEIIRQAARQSGRTRVPILDSPCTFDRSLEEKADNALGLLFYEKADDAEAPLAQLPPPRAVALWVGPEGGFTPAEITAARQHGLRIAGLGPRILRAETGGIIAVTLAQFLWGDLGA